eukprot:TRINITY_DN2396_c0_g1_i1.p1 TRINITY_DN2396_c0_g1~~TRINITY_DN2396_c0_g1_i1.p1  ORF type:complete len:480 (+),score=123.24 TRINITY_DN2396_c0_g1_i1:1035-2474(+)
MDNVVANVLSVQTALAVHLGPAVLQLSQLVAGFAMLFLLSWRLLMAGLALSTLPLLCLWVQPQVSHRLLQKMLDRLQRCAALAREAEDNLISIKMAHRERAECDRFAVCQAHVAEGIRERAAYDGCLISGSSLVRLLAVAVAVFYAARQVICGVMTPGDMLSFVFICCNIAVAGLSFKGLARQLGASTAAAQSLFLLMERVGANISFAPLTSAAGAPPIKGEIELSKVTFYFPQQLSSSDTSSFMLRSCNLIVPAGHHVGVAGPSGSGKSTLLRIVAGLYHPRAGSIKIDRHECSIVDQAGLQRQIAYLDSKVASLHGSTLAENVRFSDGSVNNATVSQALAQAGLDGVTLRALSSNGLDATVRSSCGSEPAELVLSAEMELRIALARAFLQDPKVVLVDDFFSMVDLGTEARVLPQLRDLLMGRTALIVSHRRSILADTDSIVLLEGGETVTLQDTYDAVMQDPRATFLNAIHHGDSQ